MNLVQSLPDEVWHRFLCNHPNANIFHTPEMFRVLGRAKGHRPLLWAVVDEADQPLALFLPVQVSVMDGPLRWLTTRAIAYGSVLTAPGENGRTALAALLRAYRPDPQVLFTELRNLSNLDDLRTTLTDSGLNYEDHLNYLIDLNRSPDAIMQSIGTRTRKNIRRALRDERMCVIEATQLDQVDICYDLLCKTYQAAHVPLAHRSLFHATFDELYPKGMVKFLLVQIGHDYAASSVELLFKDTIYGWYGGMDRAFSSYNPNELLIWHILDWGAQNGFKAYDFGGAGKPNEKYGVRDFKAKFGGQLVSFGRYRRVHAPCRWAAIQCFYQIYQRLMGK